MDWMFVVFERRDRWHLWVLNWHGELVLESVKDWSSKALAVRQAKRIIGACSNNLFIIREGSYEIETEVQD